MVMVREVILNWSNNSQLAVNLVNYWSIHKTDNRAIQLTERIQPKHNHERARLHRRSPTRRSAFRAGDVHFAGFAPRTNCSFC
jgi:hypothetical protein